MQKTTPADSCKASRLSRLRRIQIPQYGEVLARPDEVAFLSWVLTTRCAGVAPDSTSGIQIVHRTESLAKLAKGLAAGDMTTLAADFPSVPKTLPDDQSRRVVVLVDSVDHAIAMADRLPGWPIITGDIHGRHLTVRRRRLLMKRRSLWNSGSNMIVTAAGADSLEINSNAATTVTIWASSGQHLPPLPPAWRTVRAGEARELLIVDVDDRGHGKLATWARWRRKAYDQEEWLPPGTNLLAARIMRFLKQRPW